MEDSEQGSSFYFCALNPFERIQVGDKVLIDTKCEITPYSIVLTDPDLTFQKAEFNSGKFIGKVVSVYIQQ